MPQLLGKRVEWGFSSFVLSFFLFLDSLFRPTNRPSEKKKKKKRSENFFFWGGNSYFSPTDLLLVLLSLTSSVSQTLSFRFSVCLQQPRGPENTIPTPYPLPLKLLQRVLLLLHTVGSAEKSRFNDFSHPDSENLGERRNKLNSRTPTETFEISEDHRIYRICRRRFRGGGRTEEKKWVKCWLVWNWVKIYSTYIHSLLLAFWIFFFSFKGGFFCQGNWTSTHRRSSSTAVAMQRFLLVSDNLRIVVMRVFAHKEGERTGKSKKISFPYFSTHNADLSTTRDYWKLDKVPAADRGFSRTAPRWRRKREREKESPGKWKIRFLASPSRTFNEMKRRSRRR